MRKSGLETQKQQHPLVRRQPTKRLARCEHVGVQLSSGAPELDRIQVDRRPPPAAPKLVDREIRRGAVEQPGVIAVREPVRTPPPDADEGLLAQVLRELARTDHPLEPADQPPPFALVELLERHPDHGPYPYNDGGPLDRTRLSRRARPPRPPTDPSSRPPSAPRPRAGRPSTRGSRSGSRRPRGSRAARR